jgi:hypothetical protein
VPSIGKYAEELAQARENSEEEGEEVDSEEQDVDVELTTDVDPGRDDDGTVDDGEESVHSSPSATTGGVDALLPAASTDRSGSRDVTIAVGARPAVQQGSPSHSVDADLPSPAGQLSRTLRMQRLSGAGVSGAVSSRLSVTSYRTEATSVDGDSVVSDGGSRSMSARRHISKQVRRR